MNNENKVSIWFGNFKTEDQFNDFMKETYDDEGDMHSLFMDAFKIDFIDKQFQETLYDRKINISKLEPASYSESFLDKIEVDFSKYNCVVLLYGFYYNGLVKESVGLEFHKTLAYEK